VGLTKEKTVTTGRGGIRTRLAKPERLNEKEKSLRRIVRTALPLDAGQISLRGGVDGV